MTTTTKPAITADVTYGNDGDWITPANQWADANPWTVTLRYGRRRMTVPFWTGSAITRDPSAADVLDCLISDASSVEQARDFDDWCADFGYDTDSRRAERTYKACGRIAKRLRQFLDDEYEDALSDPDAAVARLTKET